MGRGPLLRAVLAALVLLGPLVFFLPTTAPVSAWTGRPPIRIEGDGAFTAANGVVAGAGTPGDPYVVDGWDIDASSGPGIFVANTTAHFVLRNVAVRSAPQPGSGIVLLNVTNGRVENATLLTNYYALSLQRSRDVVVANSSFSGSWIPLYSYDSGNITLDQNTFVSNVGGPYFARTTRVLMTNNTISEGGVGVHADSSPIRVSNYTFVDNTFRNLSWPAFELLGIDGLSVVRNIVSRAGAAIIAEAITDADVRFNTFDNVTGMGISFTQGGRDLVISNNVVSGVQNGWGVYLAGGARGITIENNTLLNVVNGIASGGANMEVNGNRITGGGMWITAGGAPWYRTINATGNSINGRPFAFYRDCADVSLNQTSVAQVMMIDCRRVALRNLTFGRTPTPVTLVNVEDALISSNTLNGTTLLAGMYVLGGRSVAIEKNNISNGFGDGIWVQDTADLLIVGNTLRDNWHALVLFGTTNGRIYHNNFLRSQYDQVSDSWTSGNRYDDGYPSGGNYWSEYTGQDRCSGPAQDVCTSGDGIGDTPKLIGPASDRYPLIRPFGLPVFPPSANITTQDTTVIVGALVRFDGLGSYDPDGKIVSYEWDFGDGTQGTGPIVQHVYDRVGIFTVALTVIDNHALRDTTSIVLDVRAPSAPPVAQFTTSPDAPYVTQSVMFDGGSSYALYGTIVSYAWDFGDGTGSSGPVAGHSFVAPGVYVVTLTVTTSFNVSRNTSKTVMVSDIPEIELANYTHRSGFRIPVPTTWSLTEDEQLEGVSIELVLRGAMHGSFLTNILVDTGSDPSVREDEAYLAQQVQLALDELRAQDPTSTVAEAPTYGPIGGHAGVVFAVRAPRLGILQKAALVVSDPHDRYWIVLLSVREPFSFLYNATFARMVAGFEITIEPTRPLVPASSAAIVLAVGAIVGVIVAVSLGRIRRRKKSRPVKIRVGVAGRNEKWTGIYRCPACGATADFQGSFCTVCGSPLPPSPGAAVRPEEPRGPGSP